MLGPPTSSFFFFFNDTATTEIYTLSLHDALPISGGFASSGCHQMFDAPPRFERWMMPRPSGAKIGESLNTPCASFVKRAGFPPCAGTVQISRFIPPRLREAARRLPSGDHEARPKNG